MDQIIVDGHPSLYRDSTSKAIINKNLSEYNSYMKTYKLRMSEKQRLSNLETDITELKSDINEIKNLLTNLIVKSGH